MLEHKDAHKCTWGALNRRLMIRFCIVSSDLRPHVLHTQTYTGELRGEEEFSTNYNLVMSWVRGWGRLRIDLEIQKSSVGELGTSRAGPDLQLTPPTELPSHSWGALNPRGLCPKLQLLY